MEMLEQIAAQSPGEEGRPVVDAVITPVGGGGMLSGVSIASRVGIGTAPCVTRVTFPHRKRVGPSAELGFSHRGVRRRAICV